MSIKKASDLKPGDVVTMSVGDIRTVESVGWNPLRGVIVKWRGRDYRTHIPADKELIVT